MVKILITNLPFLARIFSNFLQLKNPLYFIVISQKWGKKPQRYALNSSNFYIFFKNGIGRMERTQKVASEGYVKYYYISKRIIKRSEVETKRDREIESDRTKYKMVGIRRESVYTFVKWLTLQYSSEPLAELVDEFTVLRKFGMKYFS